MAYRSWLYVPGDKPAMLDKAFTRDADAVIVDLEDAVAPGDKDAARISVARWLSELDPDHSPPVWVRVNPGALRERDLRAVGAMPALHGVCTAKTETAEELAAVDQLLTEMGSRALVTPLLESAASLLNAQTMATTARVHSLQIGEVDLTADLGITPGPAEMELLAIRSHVVVCSAAAGINPPAGPASTNFRDMDRFRQTTMALRRLGFRGRVCIHPAQVEISNEVYTPTAEEIRAATSLLARFDVAGSGVTVDEGQMVDEAVLRHARRVLDAASFGQ
jgi:citrate lyase subunit beta/citryl-CoA lyase